MNITNEKRDAFMRIMTVVARKYGVQIEFEYQTLYSDKLRVLIEGHEYVVLWQTEFSLTEAAVNIWADFFSNTKPDNPFVKYCRRDVEMTKDLHNKMSLTIKNVIFNDPATIVFWMDGTKTVVKAQPGDTYDPEKGLAMAISKKALGNQGNYCNVFKQWIKDELVDRDGTVLYVCDKAACKVCDNPDCNCTTDISHAKNFRRCGPGYIEVYKDGDEK